MCRSSPEYSPGDRTSTSGFSAAMCAKTCSRYAPIGPAVRADSVGVELAAGAVVVELGVPVDFHRPGDVSGAVEQHVLVGFDDDEARVVEMLGKPRRGDQPLRVRVGAELGRWIGSNSHDSDPSSVPFLACAASRGVAGGSPPPPPLFCFSPLPRAGGGGAPPPPPPPPPPRPP